MSFSNLLEKMEKKNPNPKNNFEPTRENKIFSFFEHIEENASKYPDFVIYSDTIHQQELTNATLYEKSGRVYSYLKKHNIGNENFVLIHLPRGYDFCIALLGVWRAGAAAVILEDSYPKERADYIYRDCGCALEINQGNWKEILSSPVMEGHEKIDARDAAFAVYTSGSTGKPKGAIHEFGNIEKTIQSMYLEDGSFIIEENDQIALLIPFNFVAFLLFACGTLYFGKAHSYILPLEDVKNKKNLASFFLNKKINFTFLPPSYVRKLVSFGPYLKKLLVGGEPANGIYKRNIKIFNVYSTSESGFPASIFLLDKKYDVCPIGKIGKSSKIILLDENEKAVAKGEVGEVCFKNPYFRGYIHLEDETKKVLHNELYHTGDLAKVDDEGNILFLGRNNDMVKINGNRIEPGEIEEVCKNILGLNNCVAKGFEKEETIAVYYTDNKKIDVARAKNKLKDYLPYYMLPSYFYHLDEFPKNSFGKIMKKELVLAIQKEEDYVAPRNEFEKKLATTFSKVLGVEKVGIKDDFFQLGGTSLKAIELVSLLEKENISAEVLFELRTIENISSFHSVPHSKKNIKPDPFLYSLLRLVSFFVAKFIFKRSIIRNEIKKVKSPYVVLANHEAALDFVNVISLTKTRMVPVMSASYYKSMPFQFLLKRLHFIPKQQFQTDFKDILKMKEVIDSGSPLLIYPAGIQPCDGISNHISAKTWDLLKLLNTDVYIARSIGSYFVKPKWAKKYRPGKTSIDVFKLFSKEELSSLSNQQIGEKALLELEFDAYKEQDQKKWNYKNNNIEGLQNVLYICPSCKNEYTLQLKDSNTLKCSCCGFEETSDEFGMLHNPKNAKKEIRYVSDWSRFIHHELKEKINKGLNIQEPVSIHMLDEKKHCFVEKGKGVLTLNNNSLCLEADFNGVPFSLKLPSNSLTGLPVQPGKFFEIQDGEEIYRCYLDDRKKCVEIVSLLMILNEAN